MKYKAIVIALILALLMRTVPVSTSQARIQITPYTSGSKTEEHPVEIMTVLTIVSLVLNVIGIVADLIKEPDVAPQIVIEAEEITPKDGIYVGDNIRYSVRFQVAFGHIHKSGTGVPWETEGKMTLKVHTDEGVVKTETDEVTGVSEGKTYTFDTVLEAHKAGEDSWVEAEIRVEGEKYVWPRDKVVTVSAKTIRHGYNVYDAYGLDLPEVSPGKKVRHYEEFRTDLYALIYTEEDGKVVVTNVEDTRVVQLSGRGGQPPPVRQHISTYRGSHSEMDRSYGIPGTALVVLVPGEVPHPSSLSERLLSL